MIWDNCEAAISEDRAPQALGYNRAHENSLRALQCGNDLQPKGEMLENVETPASCLDA